MNKITLFSLVGYALISCNSLKNNNYEADLELLKNRTEVIELVTNNGLSRIMVVPEFQAKVLTSTYGGIKGVSNGWINRSELRKDIKHTGGALGGEDRLWIGPLGGQYSFYFGQTRPLDEENWEVPATMHDEPYLILSRSPDEVVMQKSMSLTNFNGTNFKLLVNRSVRILNKPEIEKNLIINLPTNLKYVAYQSLNTLINSGTERWQRETGLASLWSLGMFEGADNAVVIIPLGRKFELKEIYQYLGQLDSTRLEKLNKTVLFKADGKYRSKIGIPKHLSPPVYGCYKPNLSTLTIVQYQQTKDSLYFNSDVSVQENPYTGEVISLYNNGTMDYSKTSNVSFFELESASGMRELAPSDSLSHYHRVYHFYGSRNILDSIAINLLGISLQKCQLPLEHSGKK